MLWFTFAILTFVISTFLLSQQSTVIFQDALVHDNEDPGLPGFLGGGFVNYRFL